MKSIKLFLLGTISFFLWNCSENEAITDAIPYKIDEINKMPGYGWFYEEYSKYQVDTNLLNEIRKFYNPSVHKILLFTMPSCSCPNLKYKRFPQFYKILQNVGISNDQIEFYSMSSIRSRHPYDSLLLITSLPSFYILKQNKPIYSITDTLDFNIYYGKTYPIKLEELLLEGLKK